VKLTAEKLGAGGVDVCDLCHGRGMAAGTRK
jgi:hypothetical protein